MLNFGYICIVVTDLERALDFYVNKIGMKLLKKETLEGRYPERVLGIPDVKITYAKLDFETTDTPRFELHYYHNPKVEDVIPFGHISLATDNLETEYDRLQKLKVNFVSAPYPLESGGKVCFCFDPDFNLIELVENA